MLKKFISLSLAFTLMCILFTPMFAQEDSTQNAVKGNTAPAKAEGAGKEKVDAARWEGYVIRNSKDDSTLTVRDVRRSLQKVIHYNNDTQWESKEHGSKKVNKIDPSEVNNGDRVIVLGIEDKSGFHATVISKRLTPH
jgi:hypothetical protein